MLFTHGVMTQQAETKLVGTNVFAWARGCSFGVGGVVRALWYLGVIASVIVLALGIPASAQEAEPDHIRGQITKVEASSIDLRTRDGKTVSLALSDNLTIISLSKGSFTDVYFGAYVGSTAVRLDEYSPIIRDSLSWLHKGYELRIVDEALRGIALGHRKWDLTAESVIAHGWVDDLEERVISIKYGPSEYEETDVQVPRDVPVLKMSLGDKSLIKPGVQVFAGAQKDSDGKYTAAFIFVGKDDGIVPPL